MVDYRTKQVGTDLYGRRACVGNTKGKNCSRASAVDPPHIAEPGRRER